MMKVSSENLKAAVESQHGCTAMLAQQVDDFIKCGNGNLDGLHEEIKRYDGELLKTITLAANQRRTKIEERRKRDATLPFKVSRG